MNVREAGGVSVYAGGGGLKFRQCPELVWCLVLEVRRVESLNISGSD